MSPLASSPRHRLQEFYYLLTPLFFGLDFVWQAPVRVAAIDSPEWRYAYYAMLMCVWCGYRYRPSLGPWLGMLEGSANLFLLLLAVLLPVWDGPEILAAGGDLPRIEGAKIVNLFLVGAMTIVAIKTSETALLKRTFDTR